MSELVDRVDSLAFYAVLGSDGSEQRCLRYDTN